MKLLVIQNLNWVVIILLERTSRGNDVILYIKKGITFLVLDSNRDIEGIWCKVGSGANIFRLAVYFRPPYASEQYIERLCNELIEQTSGKTVIVGDFNFQGINLANYSSYLKK